MKREGEQKKGFIQRLKDRAGDLALGLLGKAFGESFVEEVQDFATAFQGLFAAFRERGAIVAHLLASPSTAFVVVTSGAASISGNTSCPSMRPSSPHPVTDQVIPP